MSDLLLRMNDLRKDLLAYLEAGVNHFQRREELKSRLHTSYDFLRHVEQLERSLDLLRMERDELRIRVQWLEAHVAVVEKERDEARAAVHAAQEQGARWALDADWNAVLEHGHHRGAIPDAGERGRAAARICTVARAKGGE